MATSSDSTSGVPSDPLAIAPFDDCLRRAREGCPQAMGQVYERCQSYLLLIANQEVDGQLRAKLGPSDLVQETLLKAQQHLGRFNGTTDSELRAWLRAILLNCIRDTNRRFQAGTKRDLARERELHAILTDYGDARSLASSETPSKQLMAAEQSDALRQALILLPADYRRVVILRNIERRGFADIGAAMDRSEAAARKLWLRAIDRLRELLEGEDERR